MSDAYMLELYLSRDQEIKALVRETLARVTSAEELPDLPDSLRNLLSLHHQKEVTELSRQISELRKSNAKQQEALEQNGQTIKWLRNQYEKVLDQQKAAFQARIDEIEEGNHTLVKALNQEICSLKKQLSSLNNQPAKINSDQVTRLKRIADMVPELVKQFDEERVKLEKECEMKLAKASQEKKASGYFPQQLCKSPSKTYLDYYEGLIEDYKRKIKHI